LKLYRILSGLDVSFTLTLQPTSFQSIRRSLSQLNLRPNSPSNDEEIELTVMRYRPSDSINELVPSGGPDLLRNRRGFF
jgi:hypothetical protein